MNASSRTKLWRRIDFLAAGTALVLSLAAGVARAQTTYTNAATGPWRTPSTWTANSGYPVAGDTAKITGGFTVTTTAGDAAKHVDVGGSTLSQLTIDGHLTLSSTTLYNFKIGPAASTYGKVVHQSGDVTSDNAMDLAVGASSTGSYEMTGGSLSLTHTSVGFLRIGVSGTGTFTQSGSSAVTLGRTHATAEGFVIGNNATGNGTYTMSGGTLNSVLAVSFIGFGGTGAMTIDGAALANLKTAVLGKNSGSAGTLNLSGGTLRANTLSKGAGAGTFNFSGGTLAPYDANATIGSATTSSNVTITLSGTNATISSSDKDGTKRTVSIWSKLTGSGSVTLAGGPGSGTNVLIAANDYTGNTTVNGGTVVWSNACLAASADLICTNTPTLSLQYTATNTIGKLFINGISQRPGIYNAGNTPAGVSITGPGAMQVTAWEVTGTVVFVE